MAVNAAVVRSGTLEQQWQQQCSQLRQKHAEAAAKTMMMMREGSVLFRELALLLSVTIMTAVYTTVR